MKPLHFILLCLEHGGGEFEQAMVTLQMPHTKIGSEMATDEKRPKAVRIVEELTQKQTVIVFFGNAGMNQDAERLYLQMPDAAIKLPLGVDARLLRASNTAPGDLIGMVNRYRIYGGHENAYNAVKYIEAWYQGDTSEVKPPKEIPFDGIYDIDTNEVFTSLSAYLSSQDAQYERYVGIFSHRSSWVSSDLETEKGIARALNARGIGTVCAFSFGETGESIDSLDYNGVIAQLFSQDGALKIDVLINFQIFMMKAKPPLSLAETNVEAFTALDIPVLRPINSYFLTQTRWEKSLNPLSFEGHSMTNAEMAGMTEPILAGVRTEDGPHTAIEERVQTLAARTARYVDLASKSNEDKHVAIVLHNAVCAGVEATIGKAYGLDALTSVANILQRLKDEGYAVENIPEDGEALKSLIFEKKAISDFRWTCAEDIVEAGGALALMDVSEYERYYQVLPEDLRSYMEETWGKPPGEGMVHENKIVITGVRFGNVRVMVQPKRGCYGAKCTGEVCKILHDPLCPPPHQYLATYRYISDVLNCDCVVHVGTDGSLEYLPGKASGLSGRCWPSVVLFDLPNFYIYNVGVPGEATTAKRRANAVTIGHLTPPAAGIDDNARKLLTMIDEYFAAKVQQNGQDAMIKEQIVPLLERLTLPKEDDFDQLLSLVQQQAQQAVLAGRPGALHVFGDNPSHDKCVDYITEVLASERSGEDSMEKNEEVRSLVEACLAGEDLPEAADVRKIFDQLQMCGNEMDALIHAMDGGYTPAGESGMPDENGRNILPTGRNMFMFSNAKVPTKIAYERGCELANQLIERYSRDEGGLPEKVALNMISVDILRTNGEQLCEVLSLIGVRPVWDVMERVVSLEAVPLKELGRPRIDVTVRISGVMRDTWPSAVALMDEAIVLTATLDESTEDNYIRKHTMTEESAICDLDERSRTMRIFGDPPGTYGAGVDLALKASAWDKDDDLAQYFIAASAFAYGKNLDGRRSVREFIENAKNVDVTSDTVSSKRVDGLACGFSMEVQGGFRLVAKSLGGKNVRQYQASNRKNSNVRTCSLAEQMQKDIDDTLLNVFWRDRQLDQGYDGASDIMHRIQNVFDAQCLNECVDDTLLDSITDTYINDPEVFAKMMEANHYATEEIARRMLELESRGKWHAAENTLDALRANYLVIEGDMENGLTGNGEVQAGEVTVLSHREVESWDKTLSDIKGYFND